MRKMIWMLTALLVLLCAGCAQGEHTSPETTLPPRTEAVDPETQVRCAALADYIRNGLTTENKEWVQLWLLHESIQQDGKGLAILAHRSGADAGGSCYAELYETVDGGMNWHILREDFRYDRGESVFVYMGEVALVAADMSKGVCGSMIISHDRGRSWDAPMTFGELLSYDPEQVPNLIPEIINYNEDTGLITFGWKCSYPEEYLAINQFDVREKRIVKEYYRAPILEAE